MAPKCLAKSHCYDSHERTAPVQGAFVARQSIETAVDGNQLQAYRNQLNDCHRLALEENQVALARATELDSDDERDSQESRDDSDSSHARNSDSDEHQTRDQRQSGSGTQEPACCQDHHEQFVQGYQGLTASSKAVSAHQAMDAPAVPVPQAGDKVTPLILAAQEGRLGACSELAQKPGVDINAAGPEGNTALHFACQHNHPTVRSFVLSIDAIVSGCAPIARFGRRYEHAQCSRQRRADGSSGVRARRVRAVTTAAWRAGACDEWRRIQGESTALARREYLSTRRIRPSRSPPTRITWTW